jgi:hypothetical protein
LPREWQETYNGNLVYNIDHHDIPFDISTSSIYNLKNPLNYTVLCYTLQNLLPNFVLVYVDCTDEYFEYIYNLLLFNEFSHANLYNIYSSIIFIPLKFIELFINKINYKFTQSNDWLSNWVNQHFTVDE